jgi:hypothetical protein
VEQLAGDHPLTLHDPFDAERRFRAAWQAVRIVRPVSYSLFTFGESELPYFLVLDPAVPKQPVVIRQGQVNITRPLIITPDNAEPELQGFFETDDDAGFARYLLARTASFSHLRLKNVSRAERIVSDSVEEAVARLNRQLDQEDEDRVAILAAPLEFASVAVVRYAAERVLQSAHDNITELRERGFLPWDS